MLTTAIEDNGLYYTVRRFLHARLKRNERYNNDN